MKIENKPLFWFGSSFYIIEFLGISIFALTLLDWSWFTVHTLKMILGGLALILYNALPGIMMYNSMQKNKKK